MQATPQYNITPTGVPILTFEDSQITSNIDNTSDIPSSLRDHLEPIDFDFFDLQDKKQKLPIKHKKMNYSSLEDVNSAPDNSNKINMDLLNQNSHKRRSFNGNIGHNNSYNNNKNNLSGNSGKIVRYKIIVILI